ncbi:hypothetical protein J2T57_000702 [Natronocella acetinitrilica]|uniref:Uncharacterized protein n=1 Tax=Natronocella acetinitrilica TaxID=414046 RepID=A0AAE3G391_9GAMM|nr:hypothetical protein [Natronocella acetinitrilica]
MSSGDKFLKVARSAALTGIIGLVAVSTYLGKPSQATSDPRPPPDLTPSYALTLSDDNQTVELSGRIDFGATAHLSYLLEHMPEVTLIRLSSGGGQIAEARGLAKVVERLALATTVAEECSSACTLVFVAGQQRHVESGARLGFHRYSVRSATAAQYIDPAREIARDMTLFRRANVKEAFLTQILDTPAESMWYPSRGELLAAGMIDPQPSDLRN